jgi:hypothetical protein
VSSSSGHRSPFAGAHSVRPSCRNSRARLDCPELQTAREARCPTSDYGRKPVVQRLPYVARCAARSAVLIRAKTYRRRVRMLACKLTFDRLTGAGNPSRRSTRDLVAVKQCENGADEGVVSAPVQGRKRKTEKGTSMKLAIVTIAIWVRQPSCRLQARALAQIRVRLG